VAQNKPVAADFLIIGCTSEIGSRLLRSLLSLGYKVDGIRHESNCKVVGENHKCVSMNLFAVDPNTLALTITARKVILASWYTKHTDFWESPLNREWGKMYRQLCQSFIDNGVKGFVGIGSCAEYSWSNPDKISELTTTSPVSLYGQEKLALLNWLNEKTSDLLWVRPFFVYGPNDHPDKLIKGAISKKASNTVLSIQESQVFVDYVFVDDVALVSAKLISINAQGVFNVGTGEAISPIEVAHIVGCDFEVLENASGCQESPKPKFVVADNEKITQALGKIEWTSLNSGISNIMTAAEFSKP
jgi:nucleoside-diphosphate-sugar epimerase